MNTDEDRRRVGLDEAIRWAWTALLQIDRIEEVQIELASTVNDRPTHYGNEQRMPFHRLRSERHFLFTAGRHLVRALDYLDVPLELPGPLAQEVTVIRNCFEHWDERDEALTGTGSRGRAYRDFEKIRPGGDPGQHKFGAGGTTIGGLNIEELRRHLTDLHRELLALEATDFVWRGSAR